jgi:hypothetical protein
MDNEKYKSRVPDGKAGIKKNIGGHNPPPKTNSESKPVTKIITKGTKEETAKNIVSKPVKDEVPKNIVKKPVADPDEEETDVSSPPVNPKVGGWKNKIKQKADVIENLTPKILRTKADTWDSISNKDEPALEKGLFILVFANEKVGKSYLGCTSSKFEGYKGKKRIIPAGWPSYILDSENSVKAEALTNFVEQYKQNKIKVHNYSIRKAGTKRRDTKATMSELDDFVLSLEKEEQGTLVVDTFTEYCDCAQDRLVEVVGKGYNEDHVPVKKLMPIQYNWRTKEVVDLLHTMRDFKINIILICQAKDEYVNETSNPLESTKSGQILADALKKTNYWVDAICVMEKDTDDDGYVERRLYVKDSRFEDKDTNKDEMVLVNENISLTNLVNLFKHKL